MTDDDAADWDVLLGLECGAACPALAYVTRQGADPMQEKSANEAALAAASKGLAAVRHRLSDAEAADLFGVLFRAALGAVRSYLRATDPPRALAPAV